MKPASFLNLQSLFVLEDFVAKHVIDKFIFKGIVIESNNHGSSPDQSENVEGSTRESWEQCVHMEITNRWIDHQKWSEFEGLI